MIDKNVYFRKKKKQNKNTPTRRYGTLPPCYREMIKKMSIYDRPISINGFN